MTRLPLATLRRSIAFVPQDNVLFGVSLGENIAYSLPEMDWEKVRWAASVSRLEKDMTEFPQGFDTLVGERGVMLSGGQRQRTCIARALVREAPIVVIDDALSSVDTATEEEILGGLKRWLAGRTALVISHRISTVKWADLILVLEGGRLVEQGSHRQLIGRGGLYARMAQRQALTEALEGELEAA
ncbi:MAG: ATP-binding cassette domain-containing protein [Candidatus Wallbacteria bacterium]|nr:ATP-binding cassette domain-containing protein [Candidatus Wallbacteria bacterium]